VTHNKDNPFLTSQPDLAKKVGGWNPFEDTVNFGAISEDLLFGAEFDKMRNGNPSTGQPVQASQQQQGGGHPTPPRRDPFGSAPFAAQEKHF